MPFCAAPSDAGTWDGGASGDPSRLDMQGGADTKFRDWRVAPVGRRHDSYFCYYCTCPPRAERLQRKKVLVVRESWSPSR